MYDNIKEMAQKEGFEQGWRDGHNASPKFPRPDIGYELLQPGYTKAFHQAYMDAYETAKDEKRRFDMLQHQRSHHKDLENEQGDIER